MLSKAVRLFHHIKVNRQNNNNNKKNISGRNCPYFLCSICSINREPVHDTSYQQQQFQQVIVVVIIISSSLISISPSAATSASPPARQAGISTTSKLFAPTATICDILSFPDGFSTPKKVFFSRRQFSTATQLSLSGTYSSALFLLAT